MQRITTSSTFPLAGSYGHACQASHHGLTHRCMKFSSPLQARKTKYSTDSNYLLMTMQTRLVLIHDLCTC